MGISQRRKGQGYEREVARVLRDTLGIDVKRNLGQVRDGGDDMTLDIGEVRVRIECKRRARISVYDWVEQCLAACKDGDIPAVVCRADHAQSLLIMRLDDVLALLAKQFLPAKQDVERT